MHGVNTILVHCNIIHSSYMHGVNTILVHCNIHSFFIHAWCKHHSGTLQYHSFIIHAWCKHHSGTLQYSFILHTCMVHKLQFPTMPLCREDTRSITQFNLPPSDCRRHFNFVSMADGSARRALGFTWRGIDYMFSSS